MFKNASFWQYLMKCIKNPILRFFKIRNIIAVIQTNYLLPLPTNTIRYLRYIAIIDQIIYAVFIWINRREIVGGQLPISH